MVKSDSRKGYLCCRAGLCHVSSMLLFVKNSTSSSFSVCRQSLVSADAVKVLSLPAQSVIHTGLEKKKEYYSGSRLFLCRIAKK